jgi:hypothetical protein
MNLSLHPARVLTLEVCPVSVHLIVLFLTALFVPVLSAEVFYVDPGGSDAGGDGSFARPWATIGAAVPKLPENGGTLIVRNGTYTAPVRITRKFKDWLIVRAENPYRAKIHVSNQTSLLIVDAAFIELTGFDISRSDPRTSSPLAAQVARSRKVILRNNIFHDSRNNDILKVNETVRELLIVGNVFYNQQGAAGEHIDVNGCSDVFIRNNIFFNDFAGSNTVDAKNTGPYVLIKNSDGFPETRRFEVSNNIFLNWQGGSGKNFLLFGEDAKPFYETQDVLVENNLMIRNGDNLMRSTFGTKGIKNVLFRNNTIVGGTSGSAFAVRLNREGPNPPNRNLRFLNNIWSDPTGKTVNFSDGSPSESMDLELRNNLYWNAGQAFPVGSVLRSTDDLLASVADPLLGPQDAIVLPRWNDNEAFISGSSTIEQEFTRLVELYGTAKEESPIRGRSLPDQSPAFDILGRVRGTAPDLGAVQIAAPPAPLRVILAPSDIPSGTRTELNQVLIDENAGPDGIVVRLKSSDPEHLSVPESVYIAPWTNFGTFHIVTAPVTSSTTVVLTAELGSTVRDTSILLTPPGVADVNLTPDVLTSGATSTRNLILVDGVTPPEGAVVELNSSHPDLVVVPKSVTIAAGNTYSPYFPITTKFVAERTLVEVSATWNGKPVSANLDVLPSTFAVVLRSDVAVAGSVVEGNRITLDKLAGPGGITVKLSSSQPSLLSVPESVFIPAGEHVGTFTYSNFAVPTRTTIRITATMEDRSVSAPVAISPLALTAFTGAATVVSNSSTTYRVVLNGRAPEGGALVSLAVEGPATVPTEVLIPAGQTSATFTLKADVVSSPQTVRIFASYLNARLSINTAVELPKIIAIFLGAVTYSGVTDGGFVTLNGPSGPGGISVSLSVDQPDRIVLSDTVLVPEGSTIGRFTYRVNKTSSVHSVLVGGSLLSSRIERKLPIAPAEVATLTMASSITGGSNLSLVVALRGIPPDGSMLEVTSSVPELIAPISVPAQTASSTNRLTIPVKRVTEETQVAVIVSYNGTSQSKTITIKP